MIKKKKKKIKTLRSVRLREKNEIFQCDFQTL